MEIANNIAKQIGNKALMMIGAKGLAAGKNYLQFRIGRNAKNINMIRVTLESNDLYKMEFMKVRKFDHNVVVDINGIYDDMLNGMIEEHTGMYTSL